VSAIAQSWSDSPGSPDLALLLAAVQAFPESLAIMEAGVVLYANPAWAQMFEYADPLQLRGRSAEEFIPQHFLHSTVEAAPQVWSGTCPAGEFAHTRPDGTQTHLQVACVGFRIKGRDFQVISARDVGSQKEAERRLRESQRMEAIGRLLGGVAHDFNNLLTGIMLYCDLLLAELDKGSRSYLHAREMRMAGEHGAELVQQLLAVARPQASQSRVLALNDVVAGTEDLLTRLMGENIALHTSLADDLGPVRMDPAKIRQILLNLVLNARDAMPDGGQITLTTRNCTDYLPSGQDRKPQLMPCVELTVIDNGCGMDAETLSRAFEPFFTTKKPGRGNGLGLATACTLAKQDGGTIVAESHPGRGTRVSVLLPRVQQNTVNQDTVNQDATSNSKVKR
jgi:two-component system cell cycle sensor histidine kinase/response regulator CckA